MKLKAYNKLSHVRRGTNVSLMNQTCISLQGSKHCQGLENFAILPAKEFKTVQELDIYLEQNSFKNQVFQQNFQRDYQCPGFKGQGGRFIDSTQCAYVPIINSLFKHRRVNAKIITKTRIWLLITVRRVVKLGF